MTLARILTTGAVVALLGGTAAMAGSGKERPKDVVGDMPAESTVDQTTTYTVPVAPSATSAAMPASTIALDQPPGTMTTRLVTNGPVADTPENRAMYKPLSRAGKMTAASGN